jgi:tRNA A-37 threonylcarbamoyl transferase component Bud32
MKRAMPIPVIVMDEYREVLTRLGLTTIEGAKDYRGELVKDHHGRRDILRIQQPNGPVLYLKRNWRPYKKDGLWSLLRHGCAWSQSRQEWENMLALQRAGLHTAGLVAYGQDCGPLCERFSFLITEAAPGQTVDQFLRDCRDAEKRRQVFDALAREIRKLHDAGMATPDLFTRHIFVDGESRFTFIDMARLDHGSPARDLAALNLTAPLRFVSEEERKRFLKVYGAPELCEPITTRMRHLADRRKFQDFFGNDDPNVK